MEQTDSGRMDPRSRKHKCNSRQKKILMVNGFHPSWKYIPMGSFGLCDFLYQQGIGAKIFNAAIYNQDQYLTQLRRTINDYQPDYIGLIIHWKELLENCIFLSYKIKELFPDLTIVAGGMTAGFLSEELLTRFKTIDFVIKGDPEKPLFLLITKEAVAKIPNLVYRHRNRVRINSSIYNIDSQTLNRICYSELRYLIRKEEYLEEINKSFGFPIFIGRGCIYNCLYCGGSKKAFREHSRRDDVVYRKIESVVRDLILLLRYTDHIYIGYEIDKEYIYNLFTAILSRKEIVKKFRLNYVTWQLMDSRLIELYSKAFRLDSMKKSIIEISPETSFDKDRKIIRDRWLYFSNKQMLKSIEAVYKKLGESVSIHIFYSRFHQTQGNKQKLISELANIHKLREYIYINRMGNLNIFYNHLATDMGSRYWDLAFKHSSPANRFDLLLEFYKKSNLPHPNQCQLNNLCIYSPKQLSGTTIFKYEQLIVWLDLLWSTVSGFYFNITKTLGFSESIMILENLINRYYFLRKWYFFRDIKVSCLIDLLYNSIKIDYPEVYQKNPDFLEGLFSLYKKYLETAWCKEDRRQRCFVERPLLNKNRFCITDYDYNSIPFYRSLNGGIGKIGRKKILNLFCLNKIYSFEYKRYHREFKLFNGKNTLPDIVNKIGKNNHFSKDELLGLCNFILSYSYYFTT